MDQIIEACQAFLTPKDCPCTDGSRLNIVFRKDTNLVAPDWPLVVIYPFPIYHAYIQIVYVGFDHLLELGTSLAQA